MKPKAAAIKTPGPQGKGVFVIAAVDNERAKRERRKELFTTAPRKTTRANTGDLDGSTTTTQKTSAERQSTRQPNIAVPAVDGSKAEEAPQIKRGRGQPRRFQTAAELQAAVDSYWEWLKANGRTVTLNKRGDVAETQYPAYWPRLLLHAGLTDSTATPYINGEYDDDVNNYSEVLSRARATVESLTAESAMRGEVNDRVAQLVLGAHHGVIQRSEVVQSGEITHRLELPNRDRLSAVAGRLSGERPAIEGQFTPVG